MGRPGHVHHVAWPDRDLGSPDLLTHPPVAVFGVQPPVVDDGGGAQRGYAWGSAVGWGPPHQADLGLAVQVGSGLDTPGAQPVGVLATDGA